MSDPAPGETARPAAPYRHERPGGNMLAISNSDTAKAVISVREGDQEAAIVVSAGAVPPLAEGLYEAAGLGRPVILERPSPRGVLVPGPHAGDEHVKVAPSPAGCPSNAPGVTLATGGVGVRLVGDEPLRVALALVDAMREAENEPDRADVESLADALARGGALTTETPVADLAVIALRWMRERETRDA
jgi:hypothetical protein